MKTKTTLAAIALTASAALMAAPLDCSPRKWDASPLSWRFDAQNAAIRSSGRATYASYISPDARRTTFTARIAPEKRTGGEWSVIGLAIGTDEKNFWHVALVVHPTNLGSRLSCELAEMRDGRWLSHHADKLRMKLHRAPGSWEFGKEHALSISLDADGVAGSVKDASGKTIFESAYAFADKPAVRFGRPAIHATGGFCGLVKNLDAESEGTVVSAEVKETFPPYESASFAPEIRDSATGFFHMAEKNGKWWAIDPLGRGTVLLGIDHVTYNGHWSKRTRRSLYREWNDAHYPSREAWIKETIGRLKAWGFNLLGAGGHAPLEHRGLVHTRFLSMGDSLCRDEHDDEFWICPNEHRPCSAFPNVFHPLFPAHCDYIARKRCAPVKDDPWLFGYFIDNELAWWGRGAQATGLFDAARSKPASHTARQALDAFVAGEIARRKLGKTPFDKLPRETRDEIRRSFLRLAAEKYFSITSAAIRRHDPNHLVLGARFAGLGGADPVVWEVSGKYCDVVTFNCYPWADIDRNVVLLSGRGAKRVADAFAERHAVVKRPMLVTEWSFPALDSGLPCTGGAGQRFRTQKDRTAATELFAKTMLSLPFLIGYDYFMWVDEPAAGISDEFPEDSNYGLVNEQGVPYPEITAMFTRLQNDIGRWRAAPLPAERPAPPRQGVLAADVRARDYPASSKTSFTPKGPAAGRLSNAAGLALDYGSPPSRRGVAVALDGREIGDYCGMLHIALPNGGETWMDASRVVSAQWKDGSLFVTFENRSRSHAFSLTHRITPSPDRARFLAELVEVRNLSASPIPVKHFFFRAYAPYAGERKPPKSVPNLWKGPRADKWLAADGRWFGLTSKAPAANACHFHWNASSRSQHPDAMCEPPEPLTLAPGASYRPPEGTMWYEAECGIQ